jgi:hypothetical protein
MISKWLQRLRGGGSSVTSEPEPASAPEPPSLPSEPSEPPPAGGASEEPAGDEPV